MEITVTTQDGPGSFDTATFDCPHAAEAHIDLLVRTQHNYGPVIPGTVTVADGEHSWTMIIGDGEDGPVDGNWADLCLAAEQARWADAEDSVPADTKEAA